MIAFALPKMTNLPRRSVQRFSRGTTGVRLTVTMTSCIVVTWSFPCRLLGRNARKIEPLSPNGPTKAVAARFAHTIRTQLLREGPTQLSIKRTYESLEKAGQTDQRQAFRKVNSGLLGHFGGFGRHASGPRRRCFGRTLSDIDLFGDFLFEECDCFFQVFADDLVV